MSHVFNPDPEQERLIREALSAQLGVDFYSPDDPDINQDVRTVEPEAASPPGELRPISVGDIIRLAQILAARSSASGETRRILYLACTAMQQLVDRMCAYEEMLRANNIAIPAIVVGPGGMSGEGGGQ